MKTLMQFFSLKMIVLAMLSTALFSAPLAGAAHLELVPVDSCSDELHEAPTERGHDGHDHDDHAHQCGQCHIHIHRSDQFPRIIVALEFDKAWLLLNDGALATSSSSHFRPPRR